MFYLCKFTPHGWRGDRFVGNNSNKAISRVTRTVTVANIHWPEYRRQESTGKTNITRRAKKSVTFTLTIKRRKERLVLWLWLKIYTDQIDTAKHQPQRQFSSSLQLQIYVLQTTSLLPMHQMHQSLPSGTFPYIQVYKGEHTPKRTLEDAMKVITCKFAVEQFFSQIFAARWALEAQWLYYVALILVMDKIEKSGFE